MEGGRGACKDGPTSPTAGVLQQPRAARFFCLFFPAVCWCWCQSGSGPRPTGRCPDAVSFLQQQCDVTRRRKETLRQSRGTLCFHQYCVLGGWVGDMRTASCRTLSSACWEILYTLPASTGMETSSAQRLLRVSWILMAEVDDTARSGGMEIPTNLAPTVFGSGSGRGP